MSVLSEKQYFKCVVKVEFEDTKGRIKYRKEEYLVNAISPTDVEVKINKEMEGAGDFEVISISQTKILSVLD